MRSPEKRVALFYWAQAAVQRRDPCVTGARRADVCVGGQIQAVAPPFRVHPAAPLRDEIDGLHLDQSEAFLSCLKLATSYKEAWMMQVARNVTMEAWGFLAPGHFLVHDRDGKYCP